MDNGENVGHCRHIYTQTRIGRLPPLLQGWLSEWNLISVYYFIVVRSSTIVRLTALRKLPCFYWRKGYEASTATENYFAACSSRSWVDIFQSVYWLKMLTWFPNSQFSSDLPHSWLEYWPMKVKMRFFWCHAVLSTPNFQFGRQKCMRLSANKRYSFEKNILEAFESCVVGVVHSYTYY